MKTVAVTNKNDYEIRLVEFDPLTVSDTVAMSTYGEQGSGKTFLAAQLPSPIGMMALDRKSKKTLASSIIANGNKVIVPEHDLVRVEKPIKISQMDNECDKKLLIKMNTAAPECCTRHYYRWYFNRVKEVAFRMADLPWDKCKSIVIDSGSVLSDDCLFANYGRNQKIMARDRGSYNNEMREFFNALQQKHVLITHRAKAIWEGDGDKAKPSGKFKAKCWNEIGYEMNVELHQYRAKPRLGVDPPTERAEEFYVDILQCQANPELVGDPGYRLLSGEDITFQNLCLLMYPGSAPEDWE